MNNREKLLNILQNQPYGYHTYDEMADYLVANGVTVQTTPMTYGRLLEIAGKMHCWIFLNTGDEYEAYDECGLTGEENYILGSRGTYCVETAEPSKEE